MSFRALSLAAGLACTQPGCAAAPADCNAEQMREIARDLDLAKAALARIDEEIEAVDARVMTAIDDYEERRIEADNIDRILIESEAASARLREEKSEAEVRFAQLLESQEVCRSWQRTQPAGTAAQSRSGG